jgi:DNA-3-methyladenine glycosylase
VPASDEPVPVSVAAPHGDLVGGGPLARPFYARDSLDVAPELLGKVLVHGRRSARIVEVEAYRGADDPGSHAYRGPTPRTRSMFGPAGHLYVYFTYGMHWCANVVCGAEGEASAVLLRAVAPLTGVEEMRAARLAARRDRDLGNGPAKLCQAMGIDGSHDGADLTDRSGPYLLDDGTFPPGEPEVTTRIGLRRGADRPWRWLVGGDEHVSRARLGARPSRP